MITAAPHDQREASIIASLAEVFDPTWYVTRYSDVTATGLQPIVHFIRIGFLERRDPNRFFASRWYLEQYPDVKASEMHPLVHYLQAGATELRDPHPDFDAPWYIGQHPEAAANPLLYHISTGQARGFPTRLPAEPQDQSPSGPDAAESALIALMQGFFDAAWYRERYPDIINSDYEPIIHFIRHGISERRDPNQFFDSLWYLEHNPDVSASLMNPLIHYLRSGAAELRSPHPNFDAAWYADQHPEAASNPLLYHLRTGLARGYLTEKPFDIQAYLPSGPKPPRPPAGLVVDVVIPVYRGLRETMRCIESVLAANGKPLGQIIVIEDLSPDQDLVDWLVELSGKHMIRLLRNARNLGFVASVNRGMQLAGNHDVVLLNSDTEVPP